MALLANFSNSNSSSTTVESGILCNEIGNGGGGGGDDYEDEEEDAGPARHFSLFDRVVVLCSLMFEFLTCKEISFHEQSLAVFLVRQHHSAFWFCVQTGVLSAKKSLLQKATDFHENWWTIKAYKTWYYILRGTLWTQIVVTGRLGIQDSNFENRMMSLALTLQSVLLNTAVFHSRLQFRAKRKIEPEVYKAAFDSARKKV